MFRQAVCFLSLLWGVLSATGLGQSKNAPLSYLKLPLAFEANQGQIDGRVQFLSRGAGYALYLTADEAVLKLSGEPQPLHMKLVGANSQARIKGRERLTGKSNYLDRKVVLGER